MSCVSPKSSILRLPKVAWIRLSVRFKIHSDKISENKNWDQRVLKGKKGQREKRQANQKTFSSVHLTREEIGYLLTHETNWEISPDRIVVNVPSFLPLLRSLSDFFSFCRRWTSANSLAFEMIISCTMLEVAVWRVNKCTKKGDSSTPFALERYFEKFWIGAPSCRMQRCIEPLLCRSLSTG